MKAVYTDKHRSHDPQFFLVRGVVKKTTEQPARADRLLAGLKRGKNQLVEPTAFGQGPRLRVHSLDGAGCRGKSDQGLRAGRACRRARA